MTARRGSAAPWQRTLGLAALVGSLIPLLGCERSSQAATDRAVVAAALAEVQPWPKLRLSVGARSVPYDQWLLLTSAADVPEAIRRAYAVDSVVANDLVRRNTGPVRLDSVLSLGRRVTWLDSAGVDRVLGGGFFTRLAAGGGVIQLSMPGYSLDGSHAVLFVAVERLGLCATGRLLILGRDADGEWRVERAIHLWIT